MQSLFHKIGGVPGIEKFLDEFYPIMLNDDRVKDYFKDIDLEALKSHQTFFLSYIFGGIPEYTRQSLKDSHSHLKITNEVFDITLDNMLKALQKVNLNTASTVAAMSILETVRDDLVSR